MPHIVVEYSENLNELQVPKLLAALHDNLAAEESVQLDRIKTRGIKLTDFVVADQHSPGTMVHITLRLMPRPDDVAKRMATNLQNIGKSFVPAGCKVSCEVVELKPETYCA